MQAKASAESMALPFIEYTLANSEHQREVAHMQAMVEGYNATDCDLREQFKKKGAMATVAFVCGRQLVVATAGTSSAYLDTGSHIHPVRPSLCCTT